MDDVPHGSGPDLFDFSLPCLTLLATHLGPFSSHWCRLFGIVKQLSTFFYWHVNYHNLFLSLFALLAFLVVNILCVFPMDPVFVCLYKKQGHGKKGMTWQALPSTMGWGYGKGRLPTLQKNITIWHSCYSLPHDLCGYSFLIDQHLYAVSVTLSISNRHGDIVTGVGDRGWLRHALLAGFPPCHHGHGFSAFCCFLSYSFAPGPLLALTAAAAIQQT